MPCPCLQLGSGTSPPKKISASASADGAVASCQPGALLTTMALACRLERGPRGIYSGSIGFISFNGAFDLNIVIRSAVLARDEVSIGAGGAIVMQSSAEGEYEEMRLKAGSVLRAIGLSAGMQELPAVDEDETNFR